MLFYIANVILYRLIARLNVKTTTIQVQWILCLCYIPRSGARLACVPNVIWHFASLCSHASKSWQHKNASTKFVLFLRDLKLYYFNLNIDLGTYAITLITIFPLNLVLVTVWMYHQIFITAYSFWFLICIKPSIILKYNIILSVIIRYL